MNNFRFYAPTDVRFGKGSVAKLKEVVLPYGKNVLMVYGGGSIKKNGLYEKVMEQLEEFNVFELSGVEPNPKIESVRKGVEICKKEKIDVVLAVGGGSTIDASKVIAGGALYDGDPWDIVMDGSKAKEVLPIVTVLTLAATGSEMNRNAVISKMETNEKIGTGAPGFIPRASICDPQYMYTLPKYQTAAGTADIMSYVFEQYFQKNDEAYLTDKFAEGILKTCIKYCKVAIDEPQNYEARSNLMWASTQALNGLLGCGKGGGWTCHPIEHELSAYYDITHGVGLAIVTIRWMRYILSEETVDRFFEYGKNVWEIDEKDKFKCANMAIDATEKFFKECGIPMTLGEIGIDDSKIEKMAEDTIKYSDLNYSYVPLTKEDVEKILRACL